MDTDYSKYHLILNAFNDAETILSSYKNRNLYNKDNQELSQLYQNIEATLLSDSIVISCPITENSQVTISRIIQYIQYLAIYFMREGLYVRGCVTRGWCYHKGNIVFGKGLIEAIEIESHKAKYPRIILTDDLVGCITELKEPEYFYKRDSDGYWILDIIRYFIEGSLLPDELKEEQSGEVININLDDMRIKISGSLKRLKDDEADIRLKYVWLAEQFNSSIDQIENKYKINSLRKYKIKLQTKPLLKNRFFVYLLSRVANYSYK